LVWHDAYVPVVIVIMIVVILAAVVLVAAGRGGEMPAPERSDYAPLEMGPVSATDVVLLRPPTALWGYNQQATDEALEQIADSIRERDVRIVALEQLLTDLSRQAAAPVPLGSPYPGARHARTVGNAVPGVSSGTGFTPSVGFPPGTGFPAGTDHATRETPPAGMPAATDPLGAPVAEEPETQETQESQQRDTQPGTGWPPEVSH
jgi:hypothetical protein